MPRIVKDPEVLCGKATIEGTRLSVELILSYLAAGTSEEELLEEYPRLTREAIRACLDYARTLVEQEVQAEPVVRTPDPSQDRLAS